MYVLISWLLQELPSYFLPSDELSGKELAARAAEYVWELRCDIQKWLTRFQAQNIVFNQHKMEGICRKIHQDPTYAEKHGIFPQHNGQR